MDGKKKTEGQKGSRKKKTDPSEIIIKVKRRYVRAKKVDLIRESKYFQALFSGNFSDSATNEINFSRDVDDMDIFKSVINYMSTNYIYLSDENIGEVLHLATYLLIDKLQKACEKYLKKNFFCENWLKFHIYATDNAVSEIEHYTDTYISSRFHDLLIFEDETLQLKPEELRYFWNNGYMKFFSWKSLTLFIAKWLGMAEHLDEKKLNVALTVLENSQKGKAQGNDEVIENGYIESVQKLEEMLKKKKKENRMADRVVKLLRQDVTDCGTADSQTGKTDTISTDLQRSKADTGSTDLQKSKTDTGSTDIHASKIDNESTDIQASKSDAVPTDLQAGKTDTVSTKVTAIFTASERKTLKRKPKQENALDIVDLINSVESDNIHDDDDLDDLDYGFNLEENITARRHIDLCVYSKKTDMWYHLGEFSEREYMRQYSQYFYDWTKNEFDDIEFEIIGCESHLIFIDKNVYTDALVYDIKNKAWRKFECRRHFEEEVLESDEKIRTMKFIVGTNNTVYLLVCVQIGEENMSRRGAMAEFDMVDFRLFYFDLESLYFFDVCETWPAYRVPKCTHWKRMLRHTSCHISESREEMIVAHYEGSGLNIVFTVNLAAEEDEDGAPEKVEFNNMPVFANPEPVEVLKEESDKDNPMFKKVKILESKDKYQILEIDDDDDDSLCVKFSYSFDSGTFTKVENGEKYKPYEKESRFVRAKRIEDCKLAFCEGSSFWMVEQNLEFGNTFQEVQFNENGKPEIIKHRPPPFTAMISASLAHVDESFFQDLEPVNHFLCKVNEN